MRDISRERRQITRSPSSSDRAPATTAAAASPRECPMTAPGRTPCCLQGGGQRDLHGEQRRLDPVLTGHDLWRGHRFGHREPRLAGDQWLGRRDGGGKHRFGRQQLRAHLSPLRTLSGEHPHRSPVVLSDRGLIRSIAVGDLAQRLGQLRPAARNDGGAYWAVPAPTRQGVAQIRQRHVLMCCHPVGQPAGRAAQFVGRGGRQREQQWHRRRFEPRYPGAQRLWELGPLVLVPGWRGRWFPRTRTPTPPPAVACDRWWATVYFPAAQRDWS